MKVAIFSAHTFEKTFFAQGNAAQAKSQTLTFFEAALNQQTAALAQGFDVVCCFVTDQLFYFHFISLM
jgi:D-lactate dehydrogenase